MPFKGRLKSFFSRPAEHEEFVTDDCGPEDSPIDKSLEGSKALAAAQVAMHTPPASPHPELLANVPLHAPGPMEQGNAHESKHEDAKPVVLPAVGPKAAPAASTSFPASGPANGHAHVKNASADVAVTAKTNPSGDSIAAASLQEKAIAPTSDPPGHAAALQNVVSEKNPANGVSTEHAPGIHASTTVRKTGVHSPGASAGTPMSKKVVVQAPAPGAAHGTQSIKKVVVHPHVQEAAPGLKHVGAQSHAVGATAGAPVTKKVVVQSQAQGVAPGTQSIKRVIVHPQAAGAAPGAPLSKKVVVKPNAAGNPPGASDPKKVVLRSNTPDAVPGAATKKVVVRRAAAGATSNASEPKKVVVHSHPPAAVPGAQLTKKVVVHPTSGAPLGAQGIKRVVVQPIAPGAAPGTRPNTKTLQSGTPGVADLRPTTNSAASGTAAEPQPVKKVVIQSHPRPTPPANEVHQSQKPMVAPQNPSDKAADAHAALTMAKVDTPMQACETSAKKVNRANDAVHATAKIDAPKVADAKQHAASNAGAVDPKIATAITPKMVMARDSPASKDDHPSNANQQKLPDHKNSNPAQPVMEGAPIKTHQSANHKEPKPGPGAAAATALPAHQVESAGANAPSGNKPNPAPPASLASKSRQEARPSAQAQKSSAASLPASTSMATPAQAPGRPADKGSVPKSAQAPTAHTSIHKDPASAPNPTQTPRPGSAKRSGSAANSAQPPSAPTSVRKEPVPASRPAQASGAAGSARGPSVPSGDKMNSADYINTAMGTLGVVKETTAVGEGMATAIKNVADMFGTEKAPQTSTQMRTEATTRQPPAPVAKPRSRQAEQEPTSTAPSTKPSIRQEQAPATSRDPAPSAKPSSRREEGPVDHELEPAEPSAFSHVNNEEQAHRVMRDGTREPQAQRQTTSMEPHIDRGADDEETSAPGPRNVHDTAFEQQIVHVLEDGVHHDSEIHQVVHYVDEEGNTIEHSSANGHRVQQTILEDGTIEEIHFFAEGHEHDQADSADFEHKFEDDNDNMPVQYINDDGSPYEPGEDAETHVQYVNDDGTPYEPGENDDAPVQYVNDDGTPYDPGEDDDAPVQYVNDDGTLYDPSENDEATVQYVNEDGTPCELGDEGDQPSVIYVNEDGTLCEPGDEDDEAAVQNVNEDGIPCEPEDKDDEAPVAYVNEDGTSCEPGDAGDRETADNAVDDTEVQYAEDGTAYQIEYRIDESDDIPDDQIQYETVIDTGETDQDGNELGGHIQEVKFTQEQDGTEVTQGVEIDYVTEGGEQMQISEQFVYGNEDGDDGLVSDNGYQAHDDLDNDGKPDINEDDPDHDPDNDDGDPDGDEEGHPGTINIEDADNDDDPDGDNDGHPGTDDVGDADNDDDPDIDEGHPGVDDDDDDDPDVGADIGDDDDDYGGAGDDGNDSDE